MNEARQTSAAGIKGSETRAKGLLSYNRGAIIV